MTATASWESKKSNTARVTDASLPENERIAIICFYDPWEDEWEALYGLTKDLKVLGIPSCFKLRADYVAALEELRQDEHLQGNEQAPVLQSHTSDGSTGGNRKPQP